MNKANLNELRQEILEFSYSHELLTQREQTWLITLLIDLIYRTEKKRTNNSQNKRLLYIQ